MKGGMKVSVEKKVFVSIYCKIFNGLFSNEMLNRNATGKEIYDFLMKDAGLSVDKNGELIPGDCNLWYLGANEAFGCLRYKDHIFSWDFGDSSFNRVECFIFLLYFDKVFTEEQFQTLMMKIQEGRTIDSMYDFPKYLKAKKEGKSWTKTKEASQFRLRIKRFAARVHQHLQNEDFIFTDPGVRE
jgi:hypothetical protein